MKVNFGFIPVKIGTLFLLLCLLCGAAPRATAQARNASRSSARTSAYTTAGARSKPTSPIGFAVRAGINRAGYHTSSPLVGSISSKAGIYLGIAMPIRLSKRSPWELQPEILYLRQSADIKLADGRTAEPRVNTVDVPIMVVRKFFDGAFRLGAGPVFTVLNSGGEVGLEAAESRLAEVAAGRFRPTVGWTAGVAAVLGKHFELEIRYCGAFSRTEIAFSGAEGVAKLRSDVWMAGVGYRF